MNIVEKMLELLKESEEALELAETAAQNTSDTLDTLAENLESTSDELAHTFTNLGKVRKTHQKIKNLLKLEKLPEDMGEALKKYNMEKKEKTK